MGVLLSLLLRLLFPRIWAWRGRTSVVCGLFGTQSALIYFLHLLWFLQQSLEHSKRKVYGCRCLEPAVSAQPDLVGSDRPGGFLWQRAYFYLRDTSPVTSSILVHMESKAVMRTLTSQSDTEIQFLIHTSVSDEACCALCCGFFAFLVLCCGFSNSASWFFPKSCMAGPDHLIRL